MRKLIIALLVIIPLSVFAADLKEGDLVFQISKSRQSPYIALAQGSPWTHCGIVVMKNGKTYVLEASSVVKLTPYKEWKERGRFGTVKAKRVFRKNLKIKYSKYLGKKYDLSFKFDNNKYYCSELLYLIYKEQFNYILATPRKIKSYNTVGLDKMMRRRGMSPNQLVVSPSDIYEAKTSYNI